MKNPEILIIVGIVIAILIWFMKNVKKVISFLNPISDETLKKLPEVLDEIVTLKNNMEIEAYREKKRVENEKRKIDGEGAEIASNNIVERIQRKND